MSKDNMRVGDVKTYGAGARMRLLSPRQVLQRNCFCVGLGFRRYHRRATERPDGRREGRADGGIRRRHGANDLEMWMRG